ncbi:uncharacterized protein LOC130980222 [Arachis stenosperma]|uniref:uncharacterized protein LOC130980222 n=1 Tax=Arachis stenosperma TaxID=217475 RepID=UPI0025ABAEBB|nr:uncharacterized protein LOC130980222 [Arachis stenosperma]
MIAGGFAGGRVTKSSHKRHLKEVYQVNEEAETPDLPAITFTKEVAQGVSLGQDDPVVITMILANANLHRTLVDQEKTSFITPKADYCYVVMPFGLKNVVTTYQQLMNKVFSPHLGKLMDFYKDNMLVKTKEETSLLLNLTEVFSTIRQRGKKLACCPISQSAPL